MMYNTEPWAYQTLSFIAPWRPMTVSTIWVGAHIPSHCAILQADSYCYSCPWICRLKFTYFSFLKNKYIQCCFVALYIQSIQEGFYCEVYWKKKTFQSSPGLMALSKAKFQWKVSENFIQGNNISQQKSKMFVLEPDLLYMSFRPVFSPMIPIKQFLVTQA